MRFRLPASSRCKDWGDFCLGSFRGAIPGIPRDDELRWYQRSVLTAEMASGLGGIWFLVIGLAQARQAQAKGHVSSLALEHRPARVKVASLFYAGF